MTQTNLPPPTQNLPPGAQPSTTSQTARRRSSLQIENRASLAQKLLSSVTDGKQRDDLLDELYGDNRAMHHPFSPPLVKRRSLDASRTSPNSLAAYVIKSGSPKKTPSAFIFSRRELWVALFCCALVSGILIFVLNYGGRLFSGKHHHHIKNLLNKPISPILTSGESPANVAASAVVIPAADSTIKGKHPKNAPSRLADLKKNRKESSPSISLHSSDLVAWQTLYDKTSGATSWNSCQNARDDPCKLCSHRVSCDVQHDGSKRISTLFLADNALKGEFPHHAVGKLVALTYMDFGSSSDVAANRNAFSVSRDEKSPCLSMLMCATATICNFHNSGLILCDSHLATNIATARRGSRVAVKPLKVQERIAWHAFYDATNGREWSKCRDARDDPCGLCPEHVECSSVISEMSGSVVGYLITALNMRNFGLNGWLPVHVFSHFSNLRVMDFGNNPQQTLAAQNVFANTHCIDMPTCFKSHYKCDVEHSGVEICPPPVVIRHDVDYATHNLASKMIDTVKAMEYHVSGNTIKTLREQDLIIWQVLYDATSGSSWISCSEQRDDPCSCLGKVVCTELKDGSNELTIVAIRLPANRLVGWLPTHALSVLSNLVLLDISNEVEPQRGQQRSLETDNILLNADCLSLARCSRDVVCELDELDLPLCPIDAVIVDEQSKVMDKAISTKCMEKARRAKSMPLSDGEQRAWDAFFNSMNGDDWAHCSNGANNPCLACPNQITCTPNDEECSWFSVQSIRLPNSRLSGWLDADLLEKFARLKTIDLSNNDQPGVGENAPIGNENVAINFVPAVGRKESSPACLDMSFCDGKVDCHFQGFISVCAANTGLENRIRRNPQDDADVFLLDAEEQDAIFARSDMPEFRSKNEESRRLRRRRRRGDKKPALPKPTSPVVIISIPGGDQENQHTMSPNDLRGFQEFYDALGGEKWTDCATARGSPCWENTCGSTSRPGEIICDYEPDTGLWRIVEIRLKSQNLRGTIKENSLYLMSSLSLLDVSNDLNVLPEELNVFSNEECLALPGCDESKCVFEETALKLCAPVHAFSAVEDAPLIDQDLHAWREFFTEMNGTKWRTCSTAYNDPCNTPSNGCEQSLERRISCSMVDGQKRLIGITLRDNRLNGRLDDSVFTRFSSLGIFDLSSSPNEDKNRNVLHSAGACVTASRCSDHVAVCNFEFSGVAMCPTARKLRRVG